ncbi:GNAT family N-acetyltransferase [Pseudalkalibacillus berkeleyi]|uniref:GNAT family N-acetyltransferase n=1 Tax=Pseudalkalibacillus berkeleyi TaxID=1069813 RepID=A0ABS9H6G1_9BACL|nr:GNAT family N-acetyltransferase [Pseudalkalibacillus berkeleyi]MCF6139544.1 GNAT family N-acetyltransferase [Pseudalkalibacillus berkeleyi]
MDLRKQIEELDFALLQSFSNKEDLEWGVLFSNEHQPDYYDANHAHVSKQPDYPEKVIDEVISFYRALSITPRFYLYDIEHMASFIALLKEKGFQFEDFSQPIQLWNQEVIQLPLNKDVTIEKVTTKNKHDASWVECQIKEFGGRVVREKAFETEFNDPRYSHYLLKYKGSPCSTACLFVHGNQGRVESVATIEEYRGKGLIGLLLQHVQKEAQNLQLDKLWVHPINERVENVYSRNGFKTILTLQCGHAFQDGKSIKGVQS